MPARVSKKQAKKMGLAVPKRPKYNNVKVVLDGVKWDSKKEAERYLVLKAMQERGEITELDWHYVYRLVVNGALVTKYESDFRYFKDGRLVVEDVKSKITRINRAYRIKKKLFEALYGLKLQEV